MPDVMPTRPIVKSPISINQNTTGITKVADATASTWSTVFRYSVPLGMAIEVTPINWFYTDFKDTANNDIAVKLSDAVRVVKANAANTESREITMWPATVFKGNVYDEFQRPKFTVPATWQASELINIDYNVSVVVDKDNTAFTLTGFQYYGEV